MVEVDSAVHEKKPTEEKAARSIQSETPEERRHRNQSRRSAWLSPVALDPRDLWTLGPFGPLDPWTLWTASALQGIQLAHLLLFLAPRLTSSAIVSGYGEM